MQALASRRAVRPSGPGCALRSPAGPAAAVRAARPVRARHIARVTEIQNWAQWETDVLASDKPVLVDIWATWCGPCKLVAPLMDWAEKEYGDKFKVVKVNHTPNPEVIAKYKVYGLPALMVFKGGELVADSHREGAVTKAILQKYVDEHILAPANA